MLQYIMDNLELFFIVILTILGLLVGDLICFLIYKLPEKLEEIWQEESQNYLFPHCNNKAKSNCKINTYYNWRTRCSHYGTRWSSIIFIGCFLFNYKCPKCNNKIQITLPIVELISGCCALVTGYLYGMSFMTIILCIFFWFILALTVIDIKSYILPDQMTLLLMWLGLVINGFDVIVSAQSAILGAALGYSFLFIVYHGFKCMTGKEGIGYGDFKLLAAFGAWFGVSNIPTILLLASLLGTIFGAVMIAFNKIRKDTPFPFGPFLSLAVAIVVLYPEFSEPLAKTARLLFLSYTDK